MPSRLLEPFVGEFLYTHVDREGLMQGTDMAAIEAVRRATTRPLTAAGGITTMEEVDASIDMGIDAVVGMALYTGRLTLQAEEGVTGRAQAASPDPRSIVLMGYPHARCARPFSSLLFLALAAASAAPARRVSFPNRTLARTSACSPARSAAGRSARRRTSAPASTSSTS